MCEEEWGGHHNLQSVSHLKKKEKGRGGMPQKIILCCAIWCLKSEINSTKIHVNIPITAVYNNINYINIPLIIIDRAGCHLQNNETQC